MKRHINKSKRVDRTCRNHGACSYCRRSRLHNANKRKQDVTSQIKDFKLDR